MLYEARNEVIKFYDDYSSMVPEVKIKATKGIALSQVKAGNKSQSLLNEIRQIVYSLYQTKEITKNLCNIIIKSIQL